MKVEWVDPSDHIYHVYNDSLPDAGNWCVYPNLAISSQGQIRPGVWRARVYHNGVEMFSEAFSIIRHPSSQVLVVNGSPISTTANSGSELTVTVYDSPASLTDWVGLYAKGAPDTSFSDWKYLNNQRQPPSAARNSVDLGFAAPTAPGIYEFRLYASDGFQRLTTSGPVNIAPVSTLAINGRTGPLSVQPGQRLSVSVENSPGNTTDWIGLYSEAAADSDFLDWRYLNGIQNPPALARLAAEIPFAAPTRPGRFEFRLFQRDSFVRVATGSPLSVVAGTEPRVSDVLTTVVSGNQLLHQVTLADPDGDIAQINFEWFRAGARLFTGVASGNSVGLSGITSGSVTLSVSGFGSEAPTLDVFTAQATDSKGNKGNLFKKTMNRRIGFSGGAVELAGVGSAVFSPSTFSANWPVDVEQTRLPDAEFVFQANTTTFMTSVRMENQFRITTQEIPLADVTAVLALPDSLIEAFSRGSNILVFAETAGGGGEEILDTFEPFVGEVDPAAKMLRVALPAHVFTDKRRSDGRFEAILTAAATPGGARPLLPGLSRSPGRSALAGSSSGLAAASCQSDPIGSPLKRTFFVKDSFRGQHYGVDIQANGDEVVAVADGFIVRLDWDLRDCSAGEKCRAGNGRRGYGKWIAVVHPALGDNTCVSIYGHLVGDKDGRPIPGSPEAFGLGTLSGIRRGQVIGRADTTGAVTGPHLHFEYFCLPAEPRTVGDIERPPKAVKTDPSPCMTGGIPSNPVPVVKSITPSAVGAGSASFTLRVNGENFASDASVRWNGDIGVITRYISPTQLEGVISPSLIARPGTATISVFNPAPGGGTSNGVIFTITSSGNPTPVVESLSPSSIASGSPAFTLAVNGSGFVSGSVVRWNGAARTTSFINANRLTASIAAADVAAAGSATVTV
ncbi:MAG: M23 family metallopeptidase, partial [Acidobacteria bacterium]|nr:M23 family metallopeptidase [Acidobacteriota bacterium]